MPPTIPTHIAANELHHRLKRCDGRPLATSAASAWCSVTHPPQMLAERVPPSAWSTSQSTSHLPAPQSRHVDHGPQRAADEPLDLLGAAQPACPAFTSRRIRSADEAGSIQYSAVTQPLPRARASTGARPRPPRPCTSPGCARSSTSTDPSAMSVKSRWKANGPQLVSRPVRRFSSSCFVPLVGGGEQHRARRRTLRLRPGGPRRRRWVGRA